jgi:hypothetical protein
VKEIGVGKGVLLAFSFVRVVLCSITMTTTTTTMMMMMMTTTTMCERKRKRERPDLLVTFVIWFVMTNDQHVTKHI